MARLGVANNPSTPADFVETLINDRNHMVANAALERHGPVGVSGSLAASFSLPASVGGERSDDRGPAGPGRRHRRRGIHREAPGRPRRPGPQRCQLTRHCPPRRLNIRRHGHGQRPGLSLFRMETCARPGRQDTYARNAETGEIVTVRGAVFLQQLSRDGSPPGAFDVLPRTEFSELFRRIPSKRRSLRWAPSAAAGRTKAPRYCPVKAFDLRR